MPMIRPTHDAVNDRFSSLGFTIHTGGAPYFEVMLTTDPGLPKDKRTPDNFYSTRGLGPLAAERGEAVYLVPADVLQRFAGADKLFYGLATFSDAALHGPELSRVPSPGSPYVNLKGFTGRSPRRMLALPRHQPRRGENGRGYTNANIEELTWAGDRAQPGTETIAPAKTPADTATAPFTPPHGNGQSQAAPVNPTAPSKSSALDYDDGYGPLPPEEPGIEGPIPDTPPGAAVQGLARAQAEGQSPEYPQASRFVAAHSGNFRTVSSPRTINRIVIHITDGGANINGPISWFQNPQARVSAHYVVGQDGEVVQMVRHNDVAWHASSANADSIGIEHVANTRGLRPTEKEYRASASLVSWLCDALGIPKDREHILGHSEADPNTKHTACPNAVWDWDSYMNLVIGGTAASTQQSAEEEDPADWEAYEIDGPINNEDVEEPIQAEEQAASSWSLAEVLPEYPQATRFVQAMHLRKPSKPRTIDRIVIHITDGGPKIEGTIAWFKNPRNEDGSPRKVSAHYIVGQSGEVVQMVRHADIAFHAGRANGRSIGIEHNARTPGALSKKWRRPDPGLAPTSEQYCASAALVTWLCDEFGIPKDRKHIIGHAEADREANPNKKPPHPDCPTGNWNWDHFMQLVTGDACQEEESDSQTEAQSLGAEGNLVSAEALQVGDLIISTEDRSDPALAGNGSWVAHTALYLGGGQGVQAIGGGARLVPLPAVLSTAPAALAFRPVRGTAESPVEVRCLGRLTNPPPQATPSAAINALGFSRAPRAAKTRPRQIRPGPASQLEAPGEITPDYSQAHSAAEALSMFFDWLTRQLKFRFAVHDTKFFPHSAIAKLRLFDAGGKLLGEGSGFYVGPNRMVTAGHCLVNDDASRVQGIEVIPGLHGLSQPFGGASVSLAGLHPHPSYDPLNYNAAYDIGVITGAPDAPNGQFFAMEELRMNPNTGIITCGYAAVNVDPTIQHMDVDSIRELQDGTFTYAAQVRQGSSGGPVFYALDECTIRAVGLNVTTYGAHQNRGLRLTDGLIGWINSV
jgi:N-acetyl-anhydromuramyl-L-alanine amidase AmpD/V8-like Glu-specific endopeptidase